jgi:hypothetical protein
MEACVKTVDLVEIIMRTNDGRQPQFVPIRMGCMAALHSGFCVKRAP